MAAVALTGAGCGIGRSPHSRTPAPSAAQRPTAVRPGSPRPAATRPPACTTARVLATWNVKRLAEQTVVVPVDENDVGSVTPEVAAGAGGVILFGSQAPQGLSLSLAELTRSAPGGIPPLVMADEEGGAVQRMANLVGWIPSAREMAATMSPAQIERLARDLGRRMKAAGVTMDLAPVLDLDGGQGPNEVNAIGTRSFSPAEKTASAAGLAFSAGLRAAGVIPVVKHFPGLGGATGNTDVALASTLPWSELQAGGLLPFAAAVRGGAPAIMVSNATVPGMTGLPASISPEVVTRLLRQRLGFSGLVLTDSLSAVALSAAGYSVPRASAEALAAGADMVLYNAAASSAASLMDQIVRAIVSAVGSGELAKSRLEDAVLHILMVKHASLCGGASRAAAHNS